MDQDINLFKELTLAESFAANNFSIEVSLYEDTYEAQKYYFTDRANIKHKISSE